MRPSMAVGLVLVLLAGCGSNEMVIFEDSFDVPLEGSRLEVKVPPGKQNVKHKIMATSSDPISVFVYLAGDEAGVKKDLEDGHITARLLAHQRETDKAEFEASLPQDSLAIIYVRRAGKATGRATNVKLKITTKK